MKTVAVYSLKGGVGKTMIAVNLAWAAAVRSSRKTLLWDLDPQGAATYLLGKEATGSRDARAAFQREVSTSRLVRATSYDRLSLIASDISLRGLDILLHELGKKKRLARLLDDIGGDFDRIILDCPPGLGLTAEQVLRCADLIVIPLIPSPLSERALHEVVEHLGGMKSGAHVLPVYNMVDRRRSLHRAALGDHPGWPAIPMTSRFERMSADRRPVGEAAPQSIGAQAIASLWQRIERRLTR